MTKQWHFRALERLETLEKYPAPPNLEDGKWYFSIDGNKLKYGKWDERQYCFIDVNGLKFSVYNSDILTGLIQPITAKINLN